MNHNLFFEETIYLAKKYLSNHETAQRGRLFYKMAMKGRSKKEILEIAKNYLRESQIEQAMWILENCQNNLYILLKLGKLYRTGKYVQKNDQLEIIYYEKSAELYKIKMRKYKHYQFTKKIGHMLSLYGKKAESYDLDRAIEIYNFSIVIGTTNCINSLIRIYVTKRENIELAMELFNSYTDKNLESYLYYTYIISCKKEYLDIQKAMNISKYAIARLITLGNNNQVTALILNYLKIVLNIFLNYKQYNNIDEIIKYQTIAAEYGSVASMLDLGDIYYKYKKDIESAMKYYWMATEHNNLSAIQNLIKIYNEQKGKCNIIIMLINKLIECNYNDGYIMLGVEYLYGDNVKVDYSKACFYFSQGIEKGCSEGYKYLSIMYEKGLGVLKNKEKAHELLKKFNDHPIIIS